MHWSAYSEQPLRQSAFALLIVFFFFAADVPLPFGLIGPPCPVVTFFPGLIGALTDGAALAGGGEDVRPFGAECEKLGHNAREPATTMTVAHRYTILFMNIVLNAAYKFIRRRPDQRPSQFRFSIQRPLIIWSAAAVH